MSEPILRGLANDEDADVRRSVAHNPAVPLDVLAHLADSIRIGPSLLPRVTAATDDDIRVAKGIAPHPALSADRLWALAERHGPSLFRRLATNPHCDPDLLHHMARNATARRTYRAVAEHPNTRGETLLLCLGDDVARRWAAAHPNLPADVLIGLVEDPNLAGCAAANPSLPVEVMERLIAAHRHDG
ncbi:hypothetical protein ABTX61_12835 [Amycolatopsis japonica]|uniref:variant leucine-rich repeat-containing protein n=1 Tax=Amycolatopsis japonica TaxID=208439 RepID=UPI0033286B33